MRHWLQLILSFAVGILSTLLFIQTNPESVSPITEVVSTPTPLPGASPDGSAVVVTKIVDGDTIVVNGSRHVRYIGIDTPETVDPRRPVGCFGHEAAEENRRLVLGKTVKLEKDVSETDRYGRLLRYVYADGVMINDALVRSGYAYAISYPPDIRHQDELREAQAEAQNAGRGLWSGCTLSPTP